VVIGAGATGLPAAIAARETGASVILVEAQNHIGGHAICSGGNISLGGGNSYQKKYGVKDSPELLFRDLIDWSVVEPNGAPPYRYNDHEIVRAFADNSVTAFDFLLAHGVKVIRSGSGQSERPRDRNVGVADAALRGHGLAHDSNRQTG